VLVKCSIEITDEAPENNGMNNLGLEVLHSDVFLRHLSLRADIIKDFDGFLPNHGDRTFLYANFHLYVVVPN